MGESMRDKMAYAPLPGESRKVKREWPAVR